VRSDAADARLIAAVRESHAPATNTLLVVAFFHALAAFVHHFV
jgi:cytochrome b561